MKIKAIEYEDYWECGEPNCCSNYETVTKFFVGDKSYEYRGYDSENNLHEFLREIMEIEIEYESVTKEVFDAS